MLSPLRLGVLAVALTALTATTPLALQPGAVHAQSHVEDVTGVRAPAISGQAALSDDATTISILGTTTGVPAGTKVTVTYRNQAFLDVRTVATGIDGTVALSIPAGSPAAANTSPGSVRLSIKRLGKRPAASVTIPVSHPGAWGTGVTTNASPRQTAGQHPPIGDPTAYSYTVTNAQGLPATWNTCQPISYQVNTDRMPDGAQAVVDEAFAYIAQVTGITFSPAGTTDRKAWVNGVEAGTNAAPGTILVYFTSASELPGLNGPVLALGGFDYDQTGSSQTITAGAVAVDVDEVTTMMPVGFGPGPTMGTVLVHELGHALNLGHSSDATQVMYPVLGPSVSGRLEAGDQAGLAALKRACA